MKKSIILLLGLVLLFAIPTLASTPENENAPAQTSEDQQFMGLATLSEEELMEIEGNHVIYETNEPDDHIIYIIELKGYQGYIIVYNDGSAIIYGVNPVNPNDGSIGDLQNIYIHNFNPLNLDSYIQQKK
ncbi:MAG: hypothetical protein NUV32_10520 [Exilispira sp.]|jgi:hypothetical protein|nr:hypothetical protein [Exilispira sp.]